MTSEEAIEILNNTAWLGTDKGIKVYPAIKVAVDALKKQERYMWHDLRKNPDDVPDEPYEPVLVAIDIGCGEVDYDIFCYGIENWSARMVIAWKHIEPFEEEK